MASLSFDDIVLTPFLCGLKNAHAFVKKGYEHAQVNKVDPKDYISHRLHDDMGDFIFQVQRMSDTAKNAMPRINPAIESVSYVDEEKTFPEVLERIEKTIKYLEAVDRKLLAGREKEEVKMTMKNDTIVVQFPALDYVQRYAHPNFWFHVTTTYAILRQKGVDVGKADFINGAGLVPMRPNVQAESK